MFAPREVGGRHVHRSVAVAVSPSPDVGGRHVHRSVAVAVFAPPPLAVVGVSSVTLIKRPWSVENFRLPFPSLGWVADGPEFLAV